MDQLDEVHSRLAIPGARLRLGCSMPKPSSFFPTLNCPPNRGKLKVLIGFEDENTAYGEVCFQAYHRVDIEGEDRELFVSGRYSDRYERRKSVWKIAHRAEVNDWTRNIAPADRYFRDSPQQLRGARGDDYSADYIGKVV